MKKTFILTVFMMLCSLAFGEKGNVAKIGETEYATLSAAIAAATAGQTITFIADIEENVTISKNLTIDGDNKYYSGLMMGGAGYIIKIQNIKFLNGGFKKDTKSATGEYYFDNCVFDGYNGYALNFVGAKYIGVNSCNVTNCSGLLYVSSSLNSNSIKNVTVDNCNYGVRMASTNTTNLENFVVTNTCWPVQIQTTGERTVNMTNCSITGTRDYNESYPGESFSSYGGTTYNVTFNFKGTNEIDIIPTDSNLKYKLIDNTSTLIAPAGMSFGENVVYKIIDSKYGYTRKGDDETIVAKIGGTNYISLADAVATAPKESTVVLVASATGAGVVINKDVTIDFNGNTYSFNEGVGSTGTESNGFQILSGDVKLMNGTLNVAEAASREFYIIIQNYTNLTVENMVLDGKYLDKWAVVETDQDSYVLSNNGGEVHIVNTHIMANNDGDKAYAFDVDKTAVVYVEGEDTKIEGKVAVTGGQYNLNISAGTFTNEIMKDWCHEAYVPTQNESVWTVREGIFVAEVVGQVKAKYETIDEAAARANSIEGTQTILVLADNVASAPVVVTDEIIDLNGNAVKADIIGTIITNGGLWTTPQNYKMIGVGAEYYATEAATIVMGANSIEMQEGEVTLVPSVWYTLDNQTLTIASGAKFNIGAGQTFVVRENTSVLNNGTVNNAGTVQILAGATVKGNLIGNIAFAGGSLITADIDPTTGDNFKMVGKLGDSNYYYNTNNAAINISANGSVAIMSGDMTLGKSWRTLPGQTVTVADNASFTVPAGMTYEIRGTVVAAEGARLTTNGEVILAATTATLTAAEGLKVKSGVENYVVKYAEGVYSLSELQLATINSGWNWFSHYRGNDVLGQLQNQLIGNGGNQIKSHMDGFTFVNGGEWEGNLEATSPAKMYMIHNTEAADVEIQGDLADAATEITIHKGWNWIGYPVSESVNFEDALEDLIGKAQHGDRIKSRNNGYLEFISNGNFTGWDGGMESFVPGQGYMYYSNSETEYTFTYTVPASKAEARANVTADNNHWVPNSADYANNMTVTAVLNIDGNMMKEGYEVAAFANGEVRGSARPVFVESIGQYVMFMTIYGEGGEELTFKCYDIYSDEEYTLSDRMAYADDAIIGSIGNPYMLTLNTMGIGENGYSTISLYPNPTTTNATISFEATCDMVEVFNSLGVRVAEYRNVDSIDGMEAAGVYVIRVTNGETVQNCRLIVK